MIYRAFGRQLHSKIALVVAGGENQRPENLEAWFSRSVWPLSVQIFVRKISRESKFHMQPLSALPHSRCTHALLVHSETMLCDGWDRILHDMDSAGDNALRSHYVPGCLRMEEHWDSCCRIVHPPEIEVSVNEKIRILDHRCVVGPPRLIDVVARCWFDSFWCGAVVAAVCPDVAVHALSRTLVTDCRLGIGIKSPVPLNRRDSIHISTVLLGQHLDAGLELGRTAKQLMAFATGSAGEPSKLILPPLRRSLKKESV